MPRVYWGWVVCLMFVLLLTMGFGIVMSFAEMLVPISRDLDVSLSLLVYIGVMPASVSLIFAPICTYLYTKISKEPTRKLVALGIILVSLGCLSVGVFREYGLISLIILSVLGGTGLLLTINPPFQLMNDYFPFKHPRHVLATSVAALGFPLATLLFNPISYGLLTTIGWQSCYLVYSLMVLIVGAAAVVVFRPIRPGELDQELGLVDSEVTSPANQNQEKHERLEECKEIVSPNLSEDSTQLFASPSSSAVDYDKLTSSTCGHLKGSTETTTGGVAVPLRTMILLGTVWFITSMLKGMGYFSPLALLVKRMDVLGIPQNQASRAMVIIGVCELISRLVTSYAGDRFKGNMLYLYVACSITLTAVNIYGVFAETFHELLIYSAAMGIFGGPMVAGMFSCCSEVLDGRGVVAMFTVFRSGFGIGLLVGPAVSASIYDTTRSFDGAFYFNGLMYAVIAVLYSFFKIINRIKPVWLYPDDKTVVVISSEIRPDGNRIPNEKTALHSDKK